MLSISDILKKYSKELDRLDLELIVAYSLKKTREFILTHPEFIITKNHESRIMNYEEVKKYIKKAAKKSDLERTELQKDKTGVELKGLKAINPVNNEEIPIFVADYVLAGYGTGAIMAVPAHDERDWEFAKKYDIKIKNVVEIVNINEIQNSNLKSQNQNSKLKN